MWALSFDFLLSDGELLFKVASLLVQNCDFTAPSIGGGCCKIISEVCYVTSVLCFLS